MRLKCNILSITEPTPAAAADEDDANQFDVTVPYPEHLLLDILGRCSTTKLVNQKNAVSLFSRIFDINTKNINLQGGPKK